MTARPSPTLSSRERVTVVLGATVLAAAGLVLFAILPHRRELAQLEVRREALLARDAARPAPRDPEVARLALRKAELARSVEAQRASLAKLEERFPRDAASALVAVSDLAERTGVLVRESAACDVAGDALARPRRRLAVLGTFGAIRAFTAGLAGLAPGRVRVAALDLEAVPVADLQDPEGADDLHVLAGSFVLVL